ncbi:HAD family phosphatase [Candidatus Bathyarchaeota archaeon]|nr:HAD family phosphatase [Candidatus Bathyarchaeota archaeon]
MSDAVIFDWDGTIADTTQAVVTSFQETLRRIGVEVGDAFIEKRIGIGAMNTFKEALEAVGKPYTERILEELVRHKIAAQVNLADTVTLFDGAIELLDSLRNKVPIGLASMNNRKVILNLLRKMRIAEYFQVVITADEIEHPKPSPDIFLECARILDCSPERCVVVEDSVFGVEAARRAGMKCIAVPTGAYTRRQLEKMKPNLVVRSLKERQKICDFILRS